MIIQLCISQPGFLSAAMPFSPHYAVQILSTPFSYAFSSLLWTSTSDIAKHKSSCSNKVFLEYVGPKSALHSSCSNSCLLYQLLGIISHLALSFHCSYTTEIFSLKFFIFLWREPKPCIHHASHVSNSKCIL